MSIRRRLLLIFLLTLLLLGSLGAYTAYVYRQGATQAGALRDAAHATLDAIHKLQLALYESAAAWKNVLLRGNEAERYYQYLSEFYSREREARAQILALHELVASDEPTGDLLLRVDRAYLALGQALRDAIRVYNSKLESPHLFADRIVGHQEQELEALIAQLGEAANAAHQRRLSALQGRIRNQEKLLLLFLLLIGGSAAALFFWLLDKNIGKPAEQATFLANYDPLTGLANRTLFRDRLDHAISQSRRNGRALSLLFFDLDYFKTVNDALGHHMGDQLLKQVGDRLRACVRDSDTPARLGGDEFAVILEDMASDTETGHVAQKILDAMQHPFEINGQTAHVSASIGITGFPEDANEAGELLQNADAAMYQAKRKGRGRYHFYTDALNQAVQHRLMLERQLRAGLELGQFAVHYQPQLSLTDGRVVGAEALLRFDPGNGPVPPDVFVPVLEETGLIVPVGRWVLRQACAMAAQIREQRGHDLRIAVNLSARQLQRPDFIDTVSRALSDHQLPPHCLETEITEHNLIEASTGDTTLSRLSELGVRLAIDDFGTGYSSLSYLKTFAVDLLKIDRSFIRDITQDRDDDAVTSAIIALAHKLEIEVIAEGVETIEQQAFLLQRGCDCGQGYLFSRPLPEDEFVAWIVARDRRSSASG